MFLLGLEIYIQVEHEGGVMCVDYNCTKLCGFVLHNYTKKRGPQEPQKLSSL